MEKQRTAAAKSPSSAPAATPTPQADAARDIEIDGKCMKGGFGSVATWTITLKNKSKTETYRDIRYRTMYGSESGNRLKTNRGAFQIRIGTRDSAESSPTSTMASFRSKSRRARSLSSEPPTGVLFVIDE